MADSDTALQWVLITSVGGSKKVLDPLRYTIMLVGRKRGPLGVAGGTTTARTHRRSGRQAASLAQKYEIRRKLRRDGGGRRVRPSSNIS